VMSGPPVATPRVETVAGRREWATAQLQAWEPEPCEECGEEGHVVTVQLYPRPDETRGGVRDELQRVCHCCAFGPPGRPGRGLLARLRSEQAEGDDHDIHFELLRDGRWV
jgi:hypothetical protein